jgi:hypothetical protein
MEEKQEYKIFGKTWRLNWVGAKFFILHGHSVGSDKENWALCVLENEDKKGIHFFCRVDSCNEKVPAGIVAAALTKRLNDALEKPGS